MTITTSGTSITFNDATTQTTSARTGAAITSSAVDITLTAASNQVQKVTMTAADKAVILPSTAGYTATTTGTPIFVISNGGGIDFDIKNSTGGVIFALAAGQTCTISLSGSANQNQWIGDLSSTTVVISNRGTPTTITTVAVNKDSAQQNVQIAALSSTLVVAVWRIANGNTYACAGTVSGNAITWGTATAISVVRGYTKVNIAPLSATTALIGSIAVGTGSYYNGISVSGTTITVSTISAAGTAGDSDQYPLVPLTSTTALLFYGNTGVGVAGRVVTYNGASAPTFGTAVNNANTTGPGIYPIVLSATSVLCLTTNNTGNVAYRVWSVSGTTLTIPTASATLPTTYFTNGNLSLIGISATEVILGQENVLAVQKLTISGTVVTPSTVWTYQSFPILLQNGGINYLLSATDFLSSTGGTISPFAPQTFTRYAYNTTTGVALVGTSSFTVPLVSYAYCKVTTDTAAVAGFDSANVLRGYIISIT
jgi:hypothetical protein